MAKCAVNTPACNREAFKTDSFCDRGNVDTEAFIEFPLCDHIDPPTTRTTIPPVDYPVVPFTPPPCACVNIEYVVTKKDIEDRSDIELKVDFKANGDCCDGNYETDIDLAIPCIPFDILVERGSDGGVDIEQDCSISSPNGTLDLGMTVESCTIAFKPKLKLNLPMPKEITADSEIPIDIQQECGISSPEGTFDLGLTESSCVYDFKPKMKITLPQPIEYEFTTETNVSSLGCFDSSSAPSSLVSFRIEESSSACTKRVKAKLDIKFPHVVNMIVCDDPTESAIAEGNGNVTITGGLGGTGALMMNLEEDSCGFTKAMCPELNLDLPCPLDSLNLVGDDPGGGQYIEVSKTGGAGCSATWEIHLRGGAEYSSSPDESWSGQSSSGSDASGGGGGGGGGDLSSGETSGGGGSGDAEATFTAVTGVECNPAGGITVQTSTFTINFIDHTVTSKINDVPRSPYSEAMARQLLLATVKTINDDPSILSIVDNPESEEARAAMTRLGLTDTIAGDPYLDDDKLEDFL